MDAKKGRSACECAALASDDARLIPKKTRAGTLQSDGNAARASRDRAPVLEKIAHSLTEKKVEIRADNKAFSRLSALDYKPLRRAS